MLSFQEHTANADWNAYDNHIMYYKITNPNSNVAAGLRACEENVHGQFCICIYLAIVNGNILCMIFTVHK